ncbi:MAG: hypothetical protein ACQEW8_03650 [Actinomycetota bacterium]
MSVDSTARILPELPEPFEQPERRLRPVASPRGRRRPKTAYALVALGGAILIGALQIGLSLAITQDSFVLAGLTSQQRELNLQAQAIQEQLTGLSSPQHLATNAADLGLVIAGSASYLRLSDGKSIGAGSGTEWGSTVNPNGAGAVENALLSAVAATQEKSEESSSAEKPETSTPKLPPPLTDGLPSPTTR